MSYLIVDEMHNDHPELLKDQYWDELPKNLPDNAKPEVLKKEVNQNPAEPQDFFDVPVKTSVRGLVSLAADIESSKPVEDVQQSSLSSQMTCASVTAESKEKIVQTSRKSKMNFFMPPSQTGSNLVSAADSKLSKASGNIIGPRVSIAPRSSLVPRASVIDSIYKKRRGVEAEQSIIERKMESKRVESAANLPTVQEKSFSEDESNEDSMTGPIVHTSLSRD